MSKWKPSEEQAAVIEELIAFEKKEKSAADFVRRYLPFGATRWTRIKAALDPEAAESYFDLVRDPDSVISELEDVLREIRLDAAARSRAVVEILPLRQFRAVATAVRECRSKVTPERLVKYIAPTGGGKSYLCEYLRKEFHASVVETREAWRRSYWTVLTDITRACGIRPGSQMIPRVLEDKLIEKLSNERRVLVFDEAEFFGASALNGLKLLLNKTRVTLVLAAIAEAHDYWNHYCPHEANQIARRTHAIVELGQILPVDAEHFFAADQFEDRTASIDQICAEASVFGHYSFLQRMADALEGSRKADAPEVKKTMEKVKRQMQRETGAPSVPARR